MKIALSGNIGSGKSTIAIEFAKRGFYLLSYTELIKKEVAEAMTALHITSSIEEALEKIHTKKEFYRPLLIAWADTCGWSDGTRLEKLLGELREENIVLDNIRFLVQAKIAKGNEFKILKLEGGKLLDIPQEHELDLFHFDRVIPWMESVEKRMDYILSVIA